MKTSGGAFKDLVDQLGPKRKGLRSRIASHITQHPQLYQPFFEPSVVDPGAPDQQQALDDLKKVENGTPPTTWEEYVDAVFRPARYGDEIAFRAACALLGVSITLVCGDLDRPSQVLYYTNSRSSLMVYLTHALGHFTLLVPKGSDLPDYIEAGSPPLQNQAPAPRGGGRTTEVDEAEDASWMLVLEPPVQQQAQQSQSRLEGGGLFSDLPGHLPVVPAGDRHPLSF